jgi:DNA polymerase-1
MKEYSEVVGVAQEAKSLNYLLAASERSYPDPEPILTFKPRTGAPHIKKPQNIAKKIHRILNDYSKDPTLDLWARWHRIKTNEGRETVENVLGPMPRANLSDIPFSEALEYACKDADATIGIYPYLKHKLESRGLTDALEIDLNMIPVFVDIRRYGMKIDITHMKALSDQFDTLMDKTRSEIETIYQEHTGEYLYINPGSPPQVQHLLYSLDITPTRKINTDSKTLDKLRKKHPVIDLITRYREYSKLRGTYSEALPLKADPHSRIRSDFSVTRTTTSRPASSNPNLQNIPVRTDLGRAIKSGFIAESGCLLLSADYSQIEMRVVAHESQDAKMLQIFTEGVDIHSQTASWIFDIPIESVDDKKQRYPMKRVGFGILYAIGPEGLYDQLIKENLSYTVQECEDLIRSWFDLYTGVRDYMDQLKSDAIIKGYVRDLFGRYRLIPEARSAHKWIKSKGLRQAQNAPIQGGAQEIIKIAMGKLKPVYEEFSEGGRYICRPVNHVHDDLVFEVSEEIVNDFAIVQKQIMESAVELSIPTPVDQKTGQRWGDMEKLKL